MPSLENTAFLSVLTTMVMLWLIDAGTLPNMSTRKSSMERDSTKFIDPLDGNFVESLCVLQRRPPHILEHTIAPILNAFIPSNGSIPFPV